MTQTILIRADCSPSIGAGHMMRMLALAQACRERAYDVRIACCCCSEQILGRFRNEGVTVHEYHGVEPGSTEDSNRTKILARRHVDWVILDGYHFGTTYQRGMRESGVKVLVLDDYGHCRGWCADILLNQNIYAPALQYESEMPHCKCLLGTRFALLRREFRDDLPPSRAGGGELRQVLVTLGGEDPHGATLMVVNALSEIASPQLDVRIILGRDDGQRESLLKAAASSRHGMQLFVDVHDMREMYRWADAAVTGGGSTCWEWLYYGLSAAVVGISDNQMPVCQSLASQGLAINLGPLKRLNMSQLVCGLRQLLASPRRFCPTKHVDGQGASRVAACLGGRTWLRRASLDDCKLYFDWANEAAVRRNSLNTSPISWETHQRWFGSRLASADASMYVAMDLYDNPVGQVRFERDAAGMVQVNFSVDIRFRGLGLGTEMMRLAVTKQRMFCSLPISATVKVENVASIRVFEKLGFRRVEANSDGLARLMLEAKGGSE